MSEEIKISKREKEMGLLAQALITAYAMEQIQGVPLKPAQADELFSDHVVEALKWRMETLSDRTGPLTLLDFALYAHFQLLGSVVSLSMLLEEANKVVPSDELLKLAMKASTRHYAEQAAERLTQALG